MDKQKMIESLQQLLTGLLAQANGHAIISKVLGDKGFTKLEEKYQEHANEERGYTLQMMQRILELGGEVKHLDQKGGPIYSDPLEWIKYDLEVSKQGLEFLHDLIEYSREDYKTYEMLKDYYNDEEEDLLWAEEQIELIEKIGYQNWLLKYL